MAIVNSLAIGKARKSAGNITFATVKGRTIAREKPTYVRNPQTPAQMAQREKMKTLVSAWRQWSGQIRKFYTIIAGYGSPYNEFVKVNMPLAGEMVLHPTLGVPNAKTGLQLGSGKYGSSVFAVTFDASGFDSTRIVDEQLKSEIKVGDYIGCLSGIESYPTLSYFHKILTAEDVATLKGGGTVNLGLEIQEGELYAITYLSPSRNVSNTPVLQKR